MLDAIAEIEKITAGPRPLSEADLVRLVVLRHEIGAGSVRKMVTSPAPAPTEDLFPGVVDAPEIHREELTADHVASGLRHHGALVVRGLMTPAEVERLCGHIDGHDWSAPQFPNDAQGSPNLDSAPMKCSAASLQGLVEAYQNVGMGAVLAEYFGEAPVLLSERLQVDRQVLKSGLPWHQDGAFFGGNVGAVNCFLALDACGVDATGLSVVTRRFDEVIGVEPGTRADLGYGSSFKQEEVLELAGPGRIATPALEAGDAILLDEMTMHRTAAPPKNTLARSWAITWFFAPSRFPELRHPLWFG
jgi:hypothetical protein